MKKRLTDILQGIDHTATCDLIGLTIGAVTTDSRQVASGSLFVCIQGLVVDGHDYMAVATAQGAVAIVASVERRNSLLQQTLPVIWVLDTRQTVADLADAFYGYPSAGLIMIGLTGTNGKTTTSYILEAIISAAGAVPGVIGTINYRYGGHEFPARFTTPEPLELQALLREMVDHGVTHVIMEVSSHALALHRVRGISFDGALFTNLTRDHLDFHEGMEAYYEAKKLLFSDHLRAGAAAVIVVEDEATLQAATWGVRLYDELKRQGQGLRLLTCGIGTGSDIVAKDCTFSVEQTIATIVAPGVRLPINSNLVGAFNLKNMLGAVGIALGLGLSPAVIALGLATPIRVPGRLEAVSIGGGEGQPSVLVDYAHTPDALQNVLLTLRQLNPKRLLLVFGCGGDRDPGKRQMMGEIAGRLADVAIITADNSRSEATEAIMAQIEQGVMASGKKTMNLLDPLPSGYAVISNRGEAIAMAIALAQERDIVLLSGKGHEDYQISATGTIFFDDRLEAAECLRQKRGAAEPAPQILQGSL